MLPNDNFENLLEQNFPCIRAEQEERNLCLKYLMMTKSFNNVNILKCLFHKTDGKYILNGIGFIDFNNSQTLNLTFSSEITYKDKSINVYSNITELCSKNNKVLKTKEKESYDKFSKKRKKILQETYCLNSDRKIENEYPLLNDFDRFCELLKLNKQNIKQK